jgi:excisionase family DNA binding protein
MSPSTEPKRLRPALERLHQALEDLESALLEFEETLAGGGPGHVQLRSDADLLSIPEVCQGLGMGKSWVYERLKTGEIPSIRLGRLIKVRRADLEEYLKSHHYTPPDGSSPL